jgi:hypothetical protein
LVRRRFMGTDIRDFHDQRARRRDFRHNPTSDSAHTGGAESFQERRDGRHNRESIDGGSLRSPPCRSGSPASGAYAPTMPSRPLSSDRSAMVKLQTLSGSRTGRKVMRKRCRRGSVAWAEPAWWGLVWAEEACRMRRPRAARPQVDRSAFAGFRFPAEVITVAVAGTSATGCPIAMWRSCWPNAVSKSIT